MVDAIALAKIRAAQMLAKPYVSDPNRDNSQEAREKRMKEFAAKCETLSKGKLPSASLSGGDG